MSSPGRSKSPAPASPADPALLDRMLFYALLALLCARPMIGETYEFEQISFLAALPTGSGPTPATTAWLDALLLAVSVLALARRGRWRGSALAALGIGLLAAAVVISSLVAADKPLALLAGASLVIFVVAAGALITLVQTRWMNHLLVAALLATGCATAIKCVNQVVSENPQTLQQWETVYRPQLIKQGYDPDDPLIVNFERRMRSAEAFGFIPHPNITGSGLMMCTLAAMGVLAGLCALRPRDGRQILALVASAAVFILLAIAACLTHSRGALVAGTFGVVAIVMLGFLARWIASHARQVLVCLIAGYVAIIAAAVAYGITKGTLPHSSLAFRWWYWTAAARAIADAPLTGIGRDNFAAAYMLYKAPESPEEVRDPHNLWVSLLTELGPLGFAGGAILCSVCLVAGLRRLAPPPEPVLVPDPLTPDRAWPVALGVLLVHVGVSASALGEPASMLIWAQDILLAWGLPFAVIVWVMSSFGPYPRSAGWLTAGCCAALLAALLHGLLDFTLLTPGGLAVFVLCLSGTRDGHPAAKPEGPAPAQRHARTRQISIGAAAVLIGAHFMSVVWPATRATLMLYDLDLALRTLPPTGPAAALPIVSGYTAQHGGDAATRIATRDLLQIARSPAIPDSQRLDWLTLIKDRAETICRINPRDTSNYTLLASADEELALFHSREGNAGKAVEYLREAAQSWQHAVELYPTNPRTRISAGRAWFELWRATGDEAAARHARENFEMAIWIDDRRPPEEVVRLRTKERAPLAEYLRVLPPAHSTASTAPSM